MSRKTVAVLATLDTKGEEAQYLRERIEALGAQALLLDIGVVGAPGTTPDVPREEVAAAGGKQLEQLLANPTRQEASPVMIAGATKLLRERLDSGGVHAVLGLGGTQGTPNCTQVMQALPYGFPKVMVSTVASGDVSAFVGIKDVTMSFSVGDILGLNPLTRKILANAAGAAVGMAQSGVELETEHGEKPVIGVTNLGVLTDGAMHALELFREAGYETIVFHAVGSGGAAMEQLMKEGVIGAVFDYAMGEIADAVFHGLRAGGPERLSVAGRLGLPQVVCPGGAEHIGLILSEPNVVPAAWEGRPHVFHNPIIFAPRLNGEELAQVARSARQRLASAQGRTVLMLPLKGVSRYSTPGAPLHDPEADRVFFEELARDLPEAIELVQRDLGAEDPAFVEEAVRRLIGLIEG